MKLRALAALPPSQKRAAVASIVSASMGPANGQMASVDARLAVFEEKYGMTTKQMLVAFKSGRLEDTADIAQWIVFSKVRGG
jgi:hypothetical protein